MNSCYAIMDTPVGEMTLVSDGSALILSAFGRVEQPFGRGEDGVILAAAAQLEQYFSGARRRFSVPLRPSGTGFELSVWNALLAIPYGESRTYSQTAISVGRPAACRAVGNACAKNPLPVFIPCHRVTAKGGIGGFSAGKDIKLALLGLEKSVFTGR